MHRLRRTILTLCVVFVAAGCGVTSPPAPRPVVMRGSSSIHRTISPTIPQVLQALDHLLENASLPPGAIRVAVSPVTDLDGAGGGGYAGTEVIRSRWWVVRRAPNAYVQRLVGVTDALRLWYKSGAGGYSGNTVMYFLDAPTPAGPIGAELAIDVAPFVEGAAIRATARTCVDNCLQSG